MPELPEVESLRRGLEKAIVGKRILKVFVNKPKLVSGKGNVRLSSSKKKEEFIRGLTGKTFIKIDRRAKNLVFYLQPANCKLQPSILLVHLKMSGQFVYRDKRQGTVRLRSPQASDKDKTVVGGHPIELSEKELPNKHTHVVFDLAGGTLYYNDTRMFGYLLYYPSASAFEAANHFGILGLEPLDKAFTAAYLKDALKSKKGKIKSVLMDQKVVTGLGNIYADESLFAARIRPNRSASSLTDKEVLLLYAAIKDIIRRAIGLGGSSVATYRLLDDTRGNFAREHKVYGKAGTPCPNCGRSLQKSVIQSRTTVFCVKCQE